MGKQRQNTKQQHGELTHNGVSQRLTAKGERTATTSPKKNKKQKQEQGYGSKGNQPTDLHHEQDYLSLLRKSAISDDILADSSPLECSAPELKSIPKIGAS